MKNSILILCMALCAGAVLAITQDQRVEQSVIQSKTIGPSAILVLKTATPIQTATPVVGTVTVTPTMTPTPNTTVSAGPSL